MDEKEYARLLEEGKKSLPEVKESVERFEIPRVKGHVQGNKTVITNFLQMCDVLRRPQEQIVKYLQRELATPAQVNGPRLVLGRKISSQIINAKVEQYCKEFLLCRECKKPDTKVIKEERVLFLKCTACGAKHPIRARI